jgi:hypothetical protein
MPPAAPAPLRPLRLSLWILVPTAVVVALAIAGLHWPAAREPLPLLAPVLLLGGQAGLLGSMARHAHRLAAHQQELRRTGRRLRARLIHTERTGTRVNHRHQLRLSFSLPTEHGPRRLQTLAMVGVEHLHRYAVGSEHLVCVDRSGGALVLAHPPA